MKRALISTAAIGGILLGSTVHAMAPHSPRQTLMLADFENPDEPRVRWGAREASITQSASYATHGTFGSIITFKSGEMPKVAMTDFLRFSRNRTNWSGYGALVMDLYNPQSSQLSLIVQIKDGAGHLYKEKLLLPASSAYSARIRLQDAKERLNLRRVVELSLAQWRPDRDSSLYVDAIRLEPDAVIASDLRPSPAQSEGKPAVASQPAPPQPEANWKVGWASGLVKIFQDPAQFSGHLSNPVEVSLARGEFEGVQLALIGGSRPSTIQVAVGELKAPATGKVIPKESIEVAQVGFVKTRPPYYPAASVGEWPDPLLPADSIQVPAGKVQPVWITLHAPEDLPAGRYDGTIALTDSQGRREEVALQVTVWNFTLPRVTHLKTAFDFYRFRLEKAYREFVLNGSQWFTRFDELEKKYFLEMLKYRISPVWGGDPTQAQFAWEVKPYLDSGLRVFGVGTHGGDNVWPRDSAKLEQVMKWYAKAELELRFLRLLDQAYVYVYDEPKPGDPHVAQVLAALRKEAPALKRLLVMREAPDPTLYRDWLKDVDILCIHNAAWNNEWASEYRAMGKELWIYVSSPSPPFPTLVIDEPALDHRILPWMAWKSGASGLLYWCVNFWNENPLNNPASFAPDQNGNGFLFYPGPEGPHSSIRLQALRDGIEDYEYLVLLRSLIERVRPKGSVDGELRERGRRLVAVDPTLVTSMKSYSQDPQQLLDERRAIAETIEELERII